MSDTDDQKDDATEASTDTPDTGGTDSTKAEEPDYKAEADKWKALARKHESQAKSNAEAAKRLKELEDSDKSEAQKAIDKAAAAEKRAAEAELKALRYEVATEKSVPPKLMRFLTGDTREELEAAADELLEAIKPADKEGADKDRKPKERLRPGASPSSEGTPSKDELLKAIPRL